MNINAILKTVSTSTDAQCKECYDFFESTISPEFTEAINSWAADGASTHEILCDILKFSAHPSLRALTPLGWMLLVHAIEHAVRKARS